MPANKKKPTKKSSAKKSPQKPSFSLANPLKFSRRQATIFIGLFAAIGFYVIYTTFAFSLALPTGSDQIAIEQLSGHAHALLEDGVDPQGQIPFRLYGNGLAICGTEGAVTADVQYVMKQTNLSSTQMATLVQNIANTGFLALPEHNYVHPVPTAEARQEIRLNFTHNPVDISWYNDGGAKPAAYAQVEKLITAVCASAQPYNPATVSLNIKKVNSTKGKPAAASWTLGDAAPTKDAETRAYSGAAANQVVAQLAGKTHGYFNAGGATYEAAVAKPLPKAKNEKIGDLPSHFPENTKAPKNTAHADGNKGVRYILFYASDAGSAVVDLNSTANQTRTWYAQQIGKTFDIASVTSVRGAHTARYYTSCPAGYNCNGDPLLAAYYNIYNEGYYNPNYDTQVVMAFNTGSGHACGYGSMGDGWAVNDPSSPGGGLFCYSAAKESAHEFGHNMGLHHTCCNYLMQGDPYSIYGSDCNWPYCTEDPNQRDWLYNNSQYLHRVGSITPTPPPPAPNRLDVFIKGTDGQLWQKYWSSGSWSGWNPLGGALASAPAAASWGLNHTDVFVKAADNQMWRQTWNGSSWSGWQPMGGILVSGPGAASWGANRTDVFVRGTDNQMYHIYWNGSAWSAWEPLGMPPSGGLASAPAVAAWGPNRLDVFVRGTDTQLWHKWWDGSIWNGWEPLGGGLASAPAVTSWGPNRLDVFIQGNDGQLWHKWWDGSIWNGWEPLGGGLASAPAVTSWGPNRLDVFIQGNDGQLWHKLWDNGWTGWEPLGGGLASGPGASSWNRVK